MAPEFGAVEFVLKTGSHAPAHGSADGTVEALADSAGSAGDAEVLVKHMTVHLQCTGEVGSHLLTATQKNTASGQAPMGACFTSKACTQAYGWGQ